MGKHVLHCLLLVRFVILSHDSVESNPRICHIKDLHRRYRLVLVDSFAPILSITAPFSSMIDLRPL